MTRDCLAYSKIKPAVNQIETHPYFQRESLVNFCMKHGVSITAHTPLGGGAANVEWFKSISALEDPVLQVWHSDWLTDLQVYHNWVHLIGWKCCSECEVLMICQNLLVLQGIAKKYNKTSAQIALRWGIQRNTVVIPKSDKVHRLKENMDVFDFELSEEDMKSIKGMDKCLRTNQPSCFWNIDLFA